MSYLTNIQHTIAKYIPMNSYWQCKYQPAFKFALFYYQKNIKGVDWFKYKKYIKGETSCRSK